jgi:hypothetical protein
MMIPPMKDGKVVRDEDIKPAGKDTEDTKTGT